MNLRLTALLILLGAAFAAAAAPDVLTTAAEVNALLSGEPCGRVRFRLQGEVESQAGSGSSFVLRDDTGRLLVTNAKSFLPQPGDVVVVYGWASVEPDFEPAIWSDQQVVIVGKTTPPEPLEIALADIDPKEHHLRVLKVDGVVIDAFPDAIDPWCVFLLIKSGGNVLLLAASSGRIGLDFARSLVDSRISATGIYERVVRGRRRFAGGFVSVEDADAISVVEPPSEDPFGFPELGHLLYRTPQEIAALGKRKVTGRVLAAYDADKVILRPEGCEPVDVTLASGVALPPWGATVTAVGYAEANLFRIRLVRAFVRVDAPTPAEKPAALPFDRAAERIGDQLIVRPEQHGKTLRVRGKLAAPARPTSGADFTLDCGYCTVPVNNSACPNAADGIPFGSTVEAVGICNIENDPTSVYDPFPKLRGVSLVLPPEGGLVLVSRPFAWLAWRLMIALVALLAAVLALAVWRKQLASARMKLKVDERTRLAVELHDTLSQNLAGVACQVSASRRTVDAEPESAKALLGRAEHMLGSCRTELKNCLFDLRSDTLGLRDFPTAIRKSFELIDADFRALVRFQVPRKKVEDSTAHAVLCIIRELTANAVRHGGASVVRIAGVLDGDTLRFSVRDNGSGFNTANAPGLAQGHFGLNGIRDRIKRLNGTFSIDSSPGETRAEATIPLLDATGDEK